MALAGVLDREEEEIREPAFAYRQALAA